MGRCWGAPAGMCSQGQFSDICIWLLFALIVHVQFQNEHEQNFHKCLSGVIPHIYWIVSENLQWLRMECSSFFCRRLIRFKSGHFRTACCSEMFCSVVVGCSKAAPELNWDQAFWLGAEHFSPECLGILEVFIVLCMDLKDHVPCGAKQP